MTIDDAALARRFEEARLQWHQDHGDGAHWTSAGAGIREAIALLSPVAMPPATDAMNAKLTSLFEDGRQRYRTRHYPDVTTEGDTAAGIRWAADHWQSQSKAAVGNPDLQRLCEAAIEAASSEGIELPYGRTSVAPIVRAVLTALREPSKTAAARGAIDAGGDVIFDLYGAAMFDANYVAERAFTAIIDRILNP